jgi:hypothetical protein
MNFKDVVIGFFMISPIVLVVSLLVAYLYGLLVHGWNLPRSTPRGSGSSSRSSR